jgi:hypothetical protein
MNVLDISAINEMQRIQEGDVLFNEYRKRNTAVSVQLLPELNEDKQEASDILLWFNNKNLYFEPSLSPSASSSFLEDQKSLPYSTSPSASLLLSRTESYKKITSKQIMQLSEKSFESFKAAREEYKQFRGKEIASMLDDDE